MAKFVIMMMALCALPALAMAARHPKDNRNTMVVEGRTYCDPCRAGFETSASYFIPGATVKLECKDRKTMDVMYSDEAITDKDGCYKFFVHEDHKDEMCDVKLVKSPDTNCPRISPGREQSQVILNHFNGIASQTRYANNMGFEKEEPDVFCAELMKQYQELDEED
ncbi:PREDICTED: major pollen allergen Lol p 11-like [Tarenaya hassleriana]|uniref:major pollen allergen Lol p 11-like n=1 Tax=Tarenaya hassleriana TaxID=28532 RepID=UPI00053C3496|nr:PREDICTED: major pollen allergen Lol p 11-like [Tarenaya hassleriana]